MNNFKTLRKKLNKTQLEVAKDLNLAQTTYAGYENGKAQPNLETMIRLANYFNTTLDYLFGHNTNFMLDISTLSNAQLKLINKIKNCTEHECETVLAYIDGLKTKK